MSTPEGKVKAKVKRAFASLPESYRFMPVQNGMGMPGLDFYCCVSGRFVAIETKVEGKKLTDRQMETARQITEAGGIVFVIRSDEDVEFFLARLALHTRLAPSNVGVLYDADRGVRTESRPCP